VADGESDHAATVAQLAHMAQADGIELKGCVNCIRFRFSGMSYQMSGGRRGYCSLVGFRNPGGTVEIDFVSGEHTPVPGWPDDLGLAQEARIELSNREPRPSRLNAFEGCILGLAIGDALGLPAEFRRREQILAAFGPDGITDFTSCDDPAWGGQPVVVGSDHPAGTYSDDTQMSIAVAEALLEARGGDLESIMQAMAGHFVRWLRAPENDRAPGGTCLEGCANLEAGRPWRESGVEHSKGCGSAMRAAPIGLLFWRDQARLLETARASSLPTHGHDAAIEGAAAAALLVALALHKRSPQAMYDAIMSECAPRSPDLRKCLEKLPGLIHADPAVALSRRGIGEGWVAEEAVVSALYCFWRSPADYERTVLTAVNTDGDSDSIATIAGSISGAFNGAEAIPRRWRENVENSEYLRSIAARLWEASL
jgi:ADP-ribosylglycohydrolase